MCTCVYLQRCLEVLSPAPGTREGVTAPFFQNELQELTSWGRPLIRQAGGTHGLLLRGSHGLKARRKCISRTQVKASQSLMEQQTPGMGMSQGAPHTCTVLMITRHSGPSLPHL